MYIPATDNVVKGYEIDNSLRFNDDDSAYLSRTPASAGNRKTWTWAGWVKRGNLGTVTKLLQVASTSGLGETGIYIRSDDKLQVEYYLSGANYYLRTDQLFRDSASAYHIGVIWDTTQPAASERIKIFINGVRVTAFSAENQPPQNIDGFINKSGDLHTIGRHGEYTQGYLDGYLSDVHFIDGQALTPASFGETGDYGEFKPIAYTGTYGTNGFHLDFKASGDLGNDVSGNNNDWTPTNLAATDQMIDTPSNNFAVLNVLDTQLTALLTAQEGNLEAALGNSVAWRSALATFSKNSGKIYFEFSSATTTGVFVGVGVDRYSYNGNSAYVGSTSESWSYLLSSGNKYTNAGATAYGNALAVGDVLGCAVDLDNGKLFFAKNGVWQNSADPVAGTGSAFTLPLGDDYSFAFSGVNGGNGVINFGQDSSFAGNKTAQGNTDDNGIGDFYYAPPAGYLALCTKNLDEPTVIPSEHFNTVLYTGDGASSHAITGVGFAPDWVWTKGRSSSRNHSAYDSLRGVNKRLQSSTTGAEATVSGVTSFDANGFTLGADLASNENAQTFVSWNWKANGAGVSNTDGSITSTVSANVDAGFSIVSYTGDGSASIETVGHGLPKAPEIVISKNRSSVKNWFATTDAIDGSHDSMELNLTNAKVNRSGTFATSSTFSILNGSVTNESGSNHISYCFHSVDGYSKFGSYTGNGSTDGPFVHCGFRPAYVMVKPTSLTGNWILRDNERDPYNVAKESLAADISSAEATSSSNLFDLTSNGFKLKGSGVATNANGHTYIFMAFAEHPFKYTNAR